MATKKAEPLEFVEQLVAAAIPLLEALRTDPHFYQMMRAKLRQWQPTHEGPLTAWLDAVVQPENNRLR